MISINELGNCADVAVRGRGKRASCGVCFFPLYVRVRPWKFNPKMEPPLPSFLFQSSSSLLFFITLAHVTRARVAGRGNLASSQNRAELIGKLQGSAAVARPSELIHCIARSSSFPAELYDVPRPHLYQHPNNGGIAVAGSGPDKGYIVSNGTASDGYVPMFGGGAKPVLIDPSVPLDRQE